MQTHQQQFHHVDTDQFGTESSDSSREHNKFNPTCYQAPTVNQFQSTMAKQQEAYNKVTQEMWAQKVDYSQNQTRHRTEGNSAHNSHPNSAQPQRKSSTNDRNHGAHQGHHVQNRDRGHSIELPQKSSHMDESYLSQSQAVGGSTRHSMRTNAKVHHGHQEQESESLLNQTQIIKGTSHNDRSNRMNIRQNSRQNPKSTDNSQPQIYQREPMQYKGKSSGHGKSGGTSKADANFQGYESREQHDQKVDMQDKFYHTAKVSGVSVYTKLQNGSSANQKNHANGQQQQLQQHDSKGEDNESKQYMQQVNQKGGSGAHQPQADSQRRQSSENASASQYGTTKKKVQPPQPRNRNESSQHRRSGDSNSAQTQPPQQQNKQTEPHHQKNSSHNAQSKPVGGDKFSQLVCQVPQGSTSPQMANSQPTPTSAAGQAFAQAQAAAQDVGGAQANILLGPQRKSETGRKTLVLDLDETLVHSSFKPVENPDITLPVEIDGQVCIIYVLVRPLVAQFLKRMHKLYELVIFTASLSKYADPLMQKLDPGNLCVYKLFREHCTFFNNAFVKDLTRLGRNMTDVIILDNSPVAYLFQPQNAMPAVSWYDDPSDTELDRVATLLERMAYEEDVRKVIRTIIVNNKIDPRQEQLYLASTVNANHRRDKSQRADRRPRASNFTGGHIITQNQIADAVQVEMRDVRKDEKKQREVYIPEENEQSQASIRPRHYANERGQNSRNQAAASHSRYDSSDTRQKHAAIIIEQINQRNRGQEIQEDLDSILQNVQNQSSSPSTAVNNSKVLMQKLQNSSNEIKQAYDHHKQQILQLKNEIAVLKGASVTSSPTNAAAASTTQGLQNSSRQTNNRMDKKSQQFLQEQPLRQNSDLHTNESRPPNGSGGKTRESSKKHRSGTDNGAYPKYPEMPAEQPGTSLIFKETTSKRGDNSRYARDSNDKALTQNARSSQNSKPASNISKHEIQLLQYTKQAPIEKKRDNHPVANAKQVIKLIKKSDNHSNHDVTNTQQYQLVNEQNGINVQPQSQTSQGFRQPQTTKNNNKGLFAFNNIAQNIQQQLSKVDENNRGSAQPYSHSQVNMISSHSNQPSRISSKTVKNTSSNPKTSQTLRSSLMGSKNRDQGNSSQTNKVHTSQISTNYDRSTNPGTTKRSSSVKNSSTNATRQSHDVNDIDHRQRKGSHSTTGYNNLAGSYQPHHQKRERGSSAQPIQSSNHYSRDNQLLVQNVGHRSSSTTHKGKKSMSTVGGSTGINNLFNGSQSTKHSQHHGTTLSHHQDRNGQLLSTASHNTHTHKGNSSERQQPSKVASSARQSSKGKTTQSKTNSTRDSGDHHREHQQLMMQYQHQTALKDHYNQFNATQKIPSQGLSLNQYQQSDQSRQPSSIQVMQDMLRLTQQNAASTRHSKQPGGSLLTGAVGVGSPSNAMTSDDFLKKIKQQQEQDKQRPNHANGRNDNGSAGGNQKSFTMLHQQQQQAANQAGLSINSPKYGGQRADPTILSDILNLTQISATNASVRTRTEKPTTQGQHQIKKIRVSGSANGSNGRNTAASHQSAGAHSQGQSGSTRVHSASRGSSGQTAHHNNTQSSNSHHQPRGTSGSNRESTRKSQQLNQTMKFSSTTGGGVNALLNELSAPTPKNNDYEKQTAANLFLQSQQQNQIYQTSYFGGNTNAHSDGQLGQNQLREVTRHFYNQLALEKKNNNQ